MVEVRPSPLRGVGLFATQDHPQFSVIFSDTVLVAILRNAQVPHRCSGCLRPPHPKYPVQRCSQCKTIHYCGTKCQRADWPQHREECKLIQAASQSGHVATECMRFLVRCLPYDLGSARNFTTDDNHLIHYGQAIAMLQMLMPHLKLDYKKAMEKLILIMSCALELPDQSGLAIYTHYFSKVNHSCRPNMAFIGPPKKTFAVALRDIEAGEEITYRYMDSVEELQETYCFDCRCGKCHDPLVFREIPFSSNMNDFIRNREFPLHNTSPMDAVHFILLTIQACLNAKLPIPESHLSLLQHSLEWWIPSETDEDYRVLYEQLKLRSASRRIS